jgi:hypothetical protein
MRRRVRSGKVLDPEDDENEYMLTMGMMLGLRVAVGRQENPLENQELTIPDFYQVDKYVFPPSGGGGYLVTPSHKLGHTFKFKVGDDPPPPNTKGLFCSCLPLSTGLCTPGF